MARITVEDCLKNINNRFELVLVASKRARQLAREGVTPNIAAENDKPTVIALREIAANFVNSSILDGNKPLQKIAVGIEEISGISDEIIAETQTTSAEEEPEQIEIIGNDDVEEKSISA